MPRKRYTSDISRAQFDVIRPLLGGAKRKTWPRTHEWAFVRRPSFAARMPNLCCNAAGFTTGIALPVDGGFSAI
jgi:hypothetical protein